MKLRMSATSPYVRKVLIAAHEIGVIDQIELVPTLAWSPDTDLPNDNPLGKVPALILDDGQVLFDSPVIVDYLDSLHPGPKLTPAAGPETWAQRRLHALGDGILDAAVAVRIEQAIRPQQFQWQGWVDRQVAAIDRSLNVLETECVAWGDRFGAGQIAVVTALCYLDFRLRFVDWKSTHPRLAAWAAGQAARPSVVATEPKE